jgi:central kinetochore subunit Mis15/CHL4
MPLSVPTTSSLPSTQLLPSTHPTVHKILNRLTRRSLLSLTLDWLDDRNIGTISPYLASSSQEHEESNDLYPPAQSLHELRELYQELQSGKGSKRDVVDRILEGDWRNGISLYQLAMADMQYLYDHPTSQKWTALKIVRLDNSEGTTLANDKDNVKGIPRFHPSTFLQNLQREVLPDVKAHYNLDRHTSLPLTLLRIFVIDSPYNTSLALQAANPKATNLESVRTFYIAFPDASPFIYVSLSASPTTTPGTSSISESRSLRKLVLDGIPKAFSRPRDRYKLESTSFSARNLDALVGTRGGGRANKAGGGWGIYAEEKVGKRDNPLDTNGHLPTPESEVEDVEEGAPGDSAEKKREVGMKRKREEDESVVKRRKLVAKGRFGSSAKKDDGLGIERFDVRLEDSFPSTTGTVDEDEILPDTALTDEPAGSKKKKGRRSTITAELDKDVDEVVEGDGWRPDIRITFHGQHVFAGIRELVEVGVVDGEKMPGWMTGEDGVSVGVVRDGRIKVGRR